MHYTKSIHQYVSGPTLLITSMITVLITTTTAYLNDYNKNIQKVLILIITVLKQQKWMHCSKMT